MKRLKIALVAHDHRKADMMDWCSKNSKFLVNHSLVGTGTTGTLITQVFKKQGLDIEVQCMNSGPLGGDAEIAAMVVRQEIDMAIFLIDDLNPQPHEADIMMLLRQCRVHNVPIACNRYSADLMLNSTLWDNDDYVPDKPSYQKFNRADFEKKYFVDKK